MLLLEARDGPRASGLVVCGDVEPAFSTPILSKALIGVAMAVNTIRETKKCSKARTVPQLLRPIQYCKCVTISQQR